MLPALWIDYLPSPGGQASEMDMTRDRLRFRRGWQWMRHLDDLPEGYHATARGKPGQVVGGGRRPRSGASRRMWSGRAE